jgi:hypothetical protein
MPASDRGTCAKRGWRFFLGPGDGGYASPPSQNNAVNTPILQRCAEPPRCVSPYFPALR